MRVRREWFRGEWALTLRVSRLASFFSFFSAALSGFALALFSCLIFFFSESVSLSGIFLMSLGAIVETKGSCEKEEETVDRACSPGSEVLACARPTVWREVTVGCRWA